MLSMLTVPASGYRRPPMSTSAVLVSARLPPSPEPIGVGARGVGAPADEPVRVVGQRAPHAVAVADRDRGQVGGLARPPAPPVARALPRRRWLDRCHVGPQRERGLEALLAGIALERVEAVDGD